MGRSGQQLDAGRTSVKPKTLRSSAAALPGVGSILRTYSDRLHFLVLVPLALTIVPSSGSFWMSDASNPR